MSGRWLVRAFALVSLGLLVFAAGCSNDSTKLRVMHASPDEGELNVVVDSKTESSSLAYGNATSYFSVGAGSRQLQLEPVGSTSPALQQTLTLAGNSSTTVIATNFASNLNGVVLTDDNSAPASGNIKLRFVNAAPALGPTDVYVVAPGTDITTVTPTVSNLGFESSSNYQILSAGSYEVFFTPAGSNFSVIDTGSIALTAGQIRTIVALDNTSGGFTSSTLQDLN